MSGCTCCRWVHGICNYATGRGGRIGNTGHKASPSECPYLLEARISFCDHAKLAEELVPADALSAFFGRHEMHARLPLKYPGVQVLKNAVPKFAVEAYEKTFRGEALPRTTWACISATPRGGELSDKRADKVASTDKLVVFPKASAYACLVSAYVLLQCQEVF